MRIVVQLFRLEGQRDGHVASGQPVRQTRSQHSNYRVRFVIDAQRLADNVSIGTKTLPGFVSQNDDMVFAGRTLFRQEVAAQKKSHALHPEKAWSHHSAVDHFRLLGCSKVEASSSPGDQVLKG